MKKNAIHYISNYYKLPKNEIFSIRKFSLLLNDKNKSFYTKNKPILVIFQIIFHVKFTNNE